MKTIFNKKNVLLAPAMLISFASQAALYDVELISTPDNFAHSFAEDINNKGNVVSTLRGIYNFPIDINNFPFEEELASLGENGTSACSDAKGLSQEELSTEAYSCLRSYLVKERSSFKYQQLGQLWTANNFSQSSKLTHFSVTDYLNSNTGEFNYSHSESVTAINDTDWMVGSTQSPYSLFMEDGHVEEYFLQDYVKRAYVKIGDKLTILDSDILSTSFLEGRSIANDISNNGYIVGTVSIGSMAFTLDRSLYDTNTSRFFDNCRMFSPTKVCEWEMLQQGFPEEELADGTRPATRTEDNIFVNRAYLWKLDENGNIKYQQDLGSAVGDTLISRTTPLSSYAVAVNEAGVAVGSSWAFAEGSDTIVSGEFAAIYRNDAIEIIANNKEEVSSSRAIDINDNNVLIGSAKKRFSFSPSGRNKLFYVDLNKGNDVVFIDDFFKNAETTPSAINNKGIIVGKTTAKALIASTVEHGFYYKIGEGETIDENGIAVNQMIDLNDLTPCNSPYTIVDAQAINDDGTILARATSLVDARDIFGNVITDLDENGRKQQTSVVSTIVLNLRDSGSIEKCVFEENKVERKGGSLGFGFLALSLIVLIRRFLRCK